MTKRFAPYLLFALSLVPTALCWAELLHRVYLYIHYGSQPYLNHVSEGYFGMMNSAGIFGVMILASGLFIAIRSKAAPQITWYALALAFSVTFMVMLSVMHQQNILVTYSEFVKNMGP